jgi:ABC-type branched-subunit amino acid transport system ATPase component/ABC-type branched-subunit amino acid transport system permease subunit
MFGLSVPLPAVILGMITGLTYGLLAVGLVLIYRSSRILNFAHGQVGALAAAVLGVYVVRDHVPYWLMFVLALLLGAGCSMLVEAVAVRRLRKAPAIMSIVATLGMGAFFGALSFAINTVIHNGASYPQPTGLPTLVIGTLRLTPAYLCQLFGTPIIVIGLATFLRRSRYGIALRAAAANRETAAMSGISPSRMSLIAWGSAGAIAAYSAVMQFPSQGFVSSSSSLGPTLLLRALLVAVLARMSSYTTALLAGVAVGVVEEVMLWNNPSGGQVEAILFIGLVAALLLQTRQGVRIREQGSWLLVSGWRPPPEPLLRLWPIRHLGKIGAAVLVTGFVLLGASSNKNAFICTVVLAYSLVGFSAFIVTGLTGQLSLGQFAFAGIGAIFSYHLTTSGIGFVPAFLLAALLTSLVSVVVGIPALRIRGLLLAVSTLGFAVMAQEWLFGQGWAFNANQSLGQPIFFGRALQTGRAYFVFAVPVFLVGLFIAWNAGRGALRREFVAVRDNEDGARAFGVGATAVKLKSFALAGFLAGLGGALYGHSLAFVDSSSFPAAASINVIVLTALGGLGLLMGPVLGALYIVGLPAFVHLDAATTATSTLGWLILILYFPGGLAQMLLPIRNGIISAIARLYRVQAESPTVAAGESKGRISRIALAESTAPDVKRQPDRATVPALQIQGVSKSYGGIRAVVDVSVDVASREVLGIIGPNGAGKTTLFEIIGGFTKPETGKVLLHGRDITSTAAQRRSRLGLVRSFQDARLFTTLTVLDAVRLALHSRYRPRLVPALVGLQLEGARDREAKRIVDAMGLTTFRDKSINELSTGTRRITELACIMAMRPQVILLDEPSSGIAQRETEALADVIRTLRAHLDATIVIIEHDMPLIMSISDRILAMEAGSGIALDVPTVVAADDRVIESYLGGSTTAIQRSGALQRSAVLSERCQGRTRAGDRCSRRASSGGYCAQHAAALAGV